MLESVAALLIVLSTGSPAPPLTGAECPLARVGPLHITADSVGPLPIHASVGELRRICPAALVDTTLAIASEHYGGVASLVLPVSGLEVTVSGPLAKRLDDSITLDQWIISGTNAELPEGIAIDAPFSTFLAVYGAPVDPTAFKHSVAVVWCRWPTLSFQFALPEQPAAIAPIAVSSIPRDARLVDVIIRLGPNARCR